MLPGHAFFARHELSSEALLNERIRLERIQTSIGAVAATIMASVVYSTYPAGYIPDHVVRLWFAFQYFLCIAWFSFLGAYHYKADVLRQFWSYAATIASVLYGLSWGIGWVLFAENSNQINHAVLYIVICAGVVSGGFFATAFYFPSMLAFTISSITPITVNALMNGSSLHPWLSGSIIVYALTFFGFALNLHFFLLDSLIRREREITLSRRLEEEKKQTELAHQEKNRFLAAASHDLRQPLQAIHFFQYALEKQLPIDQEWSVFKKMQESTQSLTELLDALLDISKLDAGGTEVKCQPLFLHDLLYQVYQRYFSLAANAGIDLDYVPVRLWVNSDPKLLERIIQNLVVNAIKHMGKQGRIVLGARRCAGKIRVEVHDNGVGIPLSAQSAIFKEFYQLNNPERNRDKGLGLGLSIVKRLAGLLGHEVRLVSQEGRGCVFSLTLPLASKPMFPTIVSHQTDTTSAIPIHGQVLLVEDDKTVLDALVLLFHLWGYSTITAETLDAATIFRKYPDILMIISDYQLQENCNGLQLIQQLRLLSDREIPAILITGNTSPDLLQVITQAGVAVSYKPINPRMLRRLAESMMRVSPV
ncbi:MAG TPA: hybrid sensor histidine kinase/response regulator [Candidatus Thiothrix moscowensis]|uniref:hybrid sensor histidine kinase/response regulator n=1 Tax=unclassified Thiothrix TaxID=2636184 RepID=UPI0025E817F3|nr:MULTISPECIES: hybrid sensor histidine kinase/response regulator [unclassified Thiothrix]HRJ51634.1 hybrid sensor histidine kinase/response regulator [Candidatus Thiothrix moscowensis]HRJ91949.1 hybrid sensor histidine kinase/response regulator [Candidatus Thiothrix moscowensis]